MKVIDYTPEYRDKLFVFIKEHFLKQSENYLDYRLEQIIESNEDITYNLIVLNDDDEVIGCNLFFSTNAKINDVKQKIYWSHNTLIDERYRGDAGTMLVLELIKRKHFGFGLTAYSKKIFKIFNHAFLEKASMYYIANRWIFKDSIRLFLNRNKKRTFDFPDKISTFNYSFQKINSSTELNIPNDGYWLQDKVNIDFIRDDFFLQHRFFENFNTYYFYKLIQKDNTKKDECYFVLRPIIWRKMIVLSVVDFRLDLDNKQQIELMLKVINKIAKKNRIGIVILITNLIIDALIQTSKININIFNPFFISRNAKLDVVASEHYGFANKPTLLITSADSDNDFMSQGYKENDVFL